MKHSMILDKRSGLALILLKLDLSTDLIIIKQGRIKVIIRIKGTSDNKEFYIYFLTIRKFGKISVTKDIFSQFPVNKHIFDKQAVPLKLESFKIKQVFKRI